MEGSYTITLGGESFALPPLTIGQVIEMLPVLNDAPGLLAIALKPVRPEITRADVLAMPCGLKTLNAAVTAVLKAGEFLKEPPPPGEDHPAPPVEQAPGKTEAPGANATGNAAENAP